MISTRESLERVHRIIDEWDALYERKDHPTAIDDLMIFNKIEAAIFEAHSAPAPVEAMQKEPGKVVVAACIHLECGWFGLASETVHPKHAPKDLCCPDCHDTVETKEYSLHSGQAEKKGE